jgi:hypothetical protein
LNARINFLTLERLHHILHAGIGKRAVIFAEMARKTPLFVYIYSFHFITSTYRTGKPGP